MAGFNALLLLGLCAVHATAVLAASAATTNQATTTKKSEKRSGGPCGKPLFQIGDKTIRDFEDLVKFFSLYSLIPKIDTTEVVSVDVVSAPCGAFTAEATFYLRAGTLDLRLFTSAFQKGHLQPVTQALAKAPPKRILHLGAHTGMATLYFAMQYPDAEIVAVEPDLDSFAMLRLNTAPYSKVHVEYGAAWDRSATVKLGRRDRARNRSLWQRFVNDMIEMRTGKLGDIVPSMHVGELISKHSWPSVDLVYADLEGAERIVIADPSSKDWLRKVKCMALRSGSTDSASAVIQTLITSEPKFVRKAAAPGRMLSVYCRADATDV